MPSPQVVKTTRQEAALLGASALGWLLLRAAVQPCPEGFVEDDDSSAAFLAECESAVRTLYVSVPPWQRALLIDTRFRARRRPSTREREGIPDDQLLLGLYTAPPATITVYEEEIQQSFQSVSEVIRHELSHRWGYDHKTFEMHQTCRATRKGSILHHGSKRR